MQESEQNLYPAQEGRENSAAGEEEIRKWVEAIYGREGVEDFDETLRDHPGGSSQEAFEYLRNHPTNPQTSFFREHNLTVFASELEAPKESKETQEPIQILEIGCSDGEESYSLATEMLKAGHNAFRIVAVDANPAILEQARKGEYELYVPIARADESMSGLKREHFDAGYFEDTGKRWEKRRYTGPGMTELRNSEYYDPVTKRIRHPLPDTFYNISQEPIVSPSRRVRDAVEFVRHDIVQGPVAGKFDVVLVNNVLQHYPQAAREQIVRNMLASLKPGGLLVMERTKNPISSDEAKWLNPYNKWRESFPTQFKMSAYAVDWLGTGEKYDTGAFYRYDEPSETQG